MDNGDVLEGSPLSFYHYHYHEEEVSPTTKVMKEIGYDYINLGNHDFNYGEQALLKHLDYLDAPVLTSNVLYKDNPLGPTYVIRTIDGIKIALLGVVTHYIPNFEQPDRIKNFKFIDAYSQVEKTVELVKRLEKPDYIICFYHGGFERDLDTGQATEIQSGENQAYRMVKDIPNLDILVTGHQHRTLAGKLFGTIYTQTSAKGGQIACIDIYPEEKRIKAQILPVETESSKEIEALVQQEEDECQKWLDTPLGESKVNLLIEDSNKARLHKSQLVTFLNKVQMENAGTELSGTALFTKASGFNKFITMRDLVSTYPYPNTIVAKKITGKILKEYLEKCAEFWTISQEHITVSSRYLKPKPRLYNYDMVDGVEYTITVSNDVGSRVTSLTRNGVPVVDDDEFTIAVNNFRANGGGDFTMIKDAPTIKELPQDMVVLLAEYILEHKVIDFEPVDNIIVRK